MKYIENLFRTYGDAVVYMPRNLLVETGKYRLSFECCSSGPCDIKNLKLSSRN